MGRRKIEIKPIRDDRNRSVTFLKRKGGLFKKAHELSVLCQVDVAVIIFGHNKKLYEYSSSDINETIGRFQYYGGAHEHKGPQDYAEKGGGDDDDDDEDGGDEGDVARGTPPQPEHLPASMQHHPAFQHVRQVTPHHSPPMHNGPMPPFQRGPSPMPANLSRPSSRAEQHHAHYRRTSSNLVPLQHQQQAPLPQQNYTYNPNPPFYNPQQAAQMQRPQGQPGQPVMTHPQGQTYPPPQYQPAPPQHPQMQQVLLQDGRRASMPSAFAPQANMQRQEHLQTPPQPQSRLSPQPQHRPTPSPQPTQQQFTSPPMPRPLPAHAKSQSMFTPIDDSRSILAQHWGAEASRSDSKLKLETGGPRSASIDVGAIQREQEARQQNGVSPARAPPRSPLRTASTPTAGSSRITSAPTEAKRPRLKVQIPSEQSGDEGNTASTAPEETATSRPQSSSGADNNVKQTPAPHASHGVVLPPPSPSASALLSAGAQGPPNPFARPAPPMSTNPHVNNRDALPVETPMSALPSRFMSDNLLPSPSTFYPEWGFSSRGGGGGGNGGMGGGGMDSASGMLPSPLNFSTPVVGANGQGGGWREEERGSTGKRAGEEGQEGESKRVKS